MGTKIRSKRVAVVGAGIAGSAFAMRAQAAGFNVTLFEKEKAPRHKVCGEFLSYESHPYFSSLGLDLRSLGAVEIQNIQVHGPSLSSPRVRLPHAALSLDRKTLDEALLQAALRAGVSVERGRMISTAAELDGFDVRVLATGKHDSSLLGPRNQRSNQKSDPGLESWVGWKAHLELDPSMAAQHRSLCDLYFFDGGYAGLQEVGPRSASSDEPSSFNLCAAIRSKDGHGFLIAPPNEQLQWLSRRSRPLALVLSGARWSQGWSRALVTPRVPYGYRRWLDAPDSESMGPSTFALGDQVAVIPSLAGEGMTLAVLGSKILVDALCDQVSSSEYHRRYRAAFGGGFHVAMSLHRILTHQSVTSGGIDWGLRLAPDWALGLIMKSLFSSTRSTQSHAETTDSTSIHL